MNIIYKNSANILRWIMWFFLATVVIAAIFTILGLFFEILIKSEKGNTEDYDITTFHYAAIFILTILLVLVAWRQLFNINKTSRAEFLLHIDKGFRSKETLRAKAIIHKLYCNEKNKDDGKSRNKKYIGGVSIRIEDMSQEPKNETVDDFVYLINFLDFLETTAYLCNKCYISSKDVEELLGESIGYYRKIFDDWIAYRRDKFGKDRFYNELDKFIVKKKYESL